VYDHGSLLMQVFGITHAGRTIYNKCLA